MAHWQATMTRDIKSGDVIDGGGAVVIVDYIVRRPDGYYRVEHYRRKADGSIVTGNFVADAFEEYVVWK